MQPKQVSIGTLLGVRKRGELKLPEIQRPFRRSALADCIIALIQEKLVT